MTPLLPDSQPDGSQKPTRFRFPEGFALAAAAVFGAVMVLAGLLVTQRLLTPSQDVAAREAESREDVAAALPDQDEPDEQSSDEAIESAPRGGPDDSTDNQAEAPGPDDELFSNDVDPLPCPDGVDQVICDAAEFVQRYRGQPFKEFPNVELMDDAEFDEALLVDFDEYAAELDVDGVVFSGLGLLDPDLALSQVFAELLEVGVLGFYRPDTDEMVVRGSELNLFGQSVLVHELVHAFDDQWFNLDRDDGIDGDADYGFRAVKEGNASRVEDAWKARLTDDERALLNEQEFGSISSEDFEILLSLPEFLTELQISPYQDGQVYVEGLAEEGGEASVDEALIDPPRSSEDVLHPEIDRAADPEIELGIPDAPGVPFEPLDSGRLGELRIRIWLGRSAGDGWGGDHYASWIEGGQDCIVVDMVADSEADRAELEAALAEWVNEDAEQRSFEAATNNDVDVVRASGCA